MDEELKAVALAVPGKVSKKMDDLRVADAITEIFTLFKRCNKYIDETMRGHWQRMRQGRTVLQPCFTI